MLLEQYFLFANSIPGMIISFLVICLSIAIHEFGHAKFADLAGDDTPRMLGRVTLNPLKHLDPMGTVFMAITVVYGIGIGWGKPVPMRPERMKNPRWDHFTAVAAGPISNLLQASIYAVLLRLSLSFGDAAGGAFLFLCLSGIFINVSLFLFNLIPLGPLDGHWLLGLLMPEKYRIQWYRFNQGPGTLILLLLVLAGSDVLRAVTAPFFGFFISLLLPKQI